MHPGTATFAGMSRRAARFVTCRPRLSMPRTQRDVTATFTAVHHERIEELALFRVVHLRVVEPRQRAHLPRPQALVVEQNRGRDQRSCEAPPARFVGTGHEPLLVPAVELEEPGGRLSMFLVAFADPVGGSPPTGRFRGSRCGGEASR